MNVLHVEDYAIEAQLVRDSLAWRAPEMHIEMVASVAQACARLLAFEAPYGPINGPTNGAAPARPGAAPSPPFDVVLTDLRLPDGSGMDVLKFVRERNLPMAVVVLTGSSDERSVFEALHAGADDYIAKDGDYLQTLPRTLQAALERFRADTARRVHQLRVLYAEPSDTDVDLTRRALARSAPHIVLEAVRGPDDVLIRFAEGSGATLPDVLLLDYRLPGLSALDLVKDLRQRQGLDIPVVLVTGQGAEHVARMA
ncbi:MAG: response regulator, partial [Chitinophagaceae bacterium]|nr:response regulator [Rubrivivax sp.]